MARSICIHPSFSYTFFVLSSSFFSFSSLPSFFSSPTFVFFFPPSFCSQCSKFLFSPHTFIPSFLLFSFYSQHQVSHLRGRLRREGFLSETSPRTRSAADLGAPSLGAVSDDLFIPAPLRNCRQSRSNRLAAIRISRPGERRKLGLGLTSV